MIQALAKKSLCFFLAAILVSCGSNLAPVSELRWHPYTKYPPFHRVKRGETLFAIAFRYDTDFRTLAKINKLRPPYALKVGQIVSLRGITVHRKYVHFQHKPSPRFQSVPKIIYSPPQRYAHNTSGWLWPVSGRVVVSFIPEQGKKGINIACKTDESVIASLAGVVAYAGNGLQGYGNLIILKHNNHYLTAYGYNSRILVKEGQIVRAGQVIAKAGVVDHKYTGVHFEIRKAGIPVNPLNYLKKG